MNSFLGLSIGVKGLTASQTALYTTSHNISNASTTGYSRQVVTQKASTPLKTADGSGMIGTGADITSVISIRNVFLDYRYWNENSNNGEWSVKNDTLTQLQSLIDNSSDDGLDDVLNSFKSSLEDLADDPSSDSTRAAVKEEGEALCKYLNNMASSLQNLQDDCNTSIKAKVDEINSYAKQITALNKQIYTEELDGSKANDLRDQRTVLVDKLSAIADVQVSEITNSSSNGGSNDATFSIKIDGRSLVNGNDVNELECYTSSSSSSGSAGLYNVRWADTDQDVTFSGGEIKAYLDECNGDGLNGNYKGIPYYMNQLDTFARTFAKAFNEGIYADGETHIAGNAGGQGSDGTTGTRFFSYDNKSSDELMASGTDTDSIYENITAANISLTSDVGNDTDKIAAAAIGEDAENSDNLTKLLGIFDDSNVFENGTPSDNINSIFTTMGVEADYASQMSTSHQNVLDAIDTNRTSVSGVSLDEESANLVIYQQAYSAAAKVVSVMDEILDVTINSLGYGW